MVYSAILVTLLLPYWAQAEWIDLKRFSKRPAAEHLIAIAEVQTVKNVRISPNSVQSDSFTLKKKSILASRNHTSFDGKNCELGLPLLMSSKQASFHTPMGPDQGTTILALVRLSDNKCVLDGFATLQEGKLVGTDGPMSLDEFKEKVMSEYLRLLSSR